MKFFLSTFLLLSGFSYAGGSWSGCCSEDDSLESPVFSCDFKDITSNPEAKKMFSYVDFYRKSACSQRNQEFEEMKNGSGFMLSMAKAMLKNTSSSDKIDFILSVYAVVWPNRYISRVASNESKLKIREIDETDFSDLVMHINNDTPFSKLKKQERFQGMIDSLCEKLKYIHRDYDSKNH